MPHHFDHPILEEISRLEMPDRDNIVVNHSAALALWGVDIGREPQDIDMATSLENIRYLRQQLGWATTRKVIGYHEGLAVRLLATYDPLGRFDVHRWDFSRERQAKTGRGRVSLAEQKDHSYRDEATGIYVVTPEYVLATKRGTGRRKDEQDIVFIEQYLRTA